MTRLLLIVDPQHDFIDGALPVPGAQKTMEALADFIKKNDGAYKRKIVTVDWHPWDHCSFKDEGGEWPRHCVRYSTGASVYGPVLEAVCSTAGRVAILPKGQLPSVEEYSIFANEDARAAIDAIVKDGMIDEIEICGIAGDVCVRNTLIDAVRRYGRSKVHVLEQFCPSLDGGMALAEEIDNLGLS